eukprot:scaffold428006_cov45-Prasinocladus_malaysianus.AAC.1
MAITAAGAGATYSRATQPSSFSSSASDSSEAVKEKSQQAKAKSRRHRKSLTGGSRARLEALTEDLACAMLCCEVSNKRKSHASTPLGR